MRNQYLNCKFLHGGTLTQPWPNAFVMRMKFKGNYASSWNSVLEFDWRPKKKDLHRKVKGFCPQNRVKTKKNKKWKKIFTPIWNYIQPDFGIYSCWQPLFRLIRHPDAYSQWRKRWNLVTKDAEISMGGCIPPRPSFNLSTVFNKLL